MTTPTLTAPGITRRPFGQLPDGREVHEYTLDNGRGMTLSAINLGGIVTSIRVPDRHGRSGSVVLGFTDLIDYVERNPNFGVIVGRYANRIAGGRFMLDGIAYQLECNDGPNALHGGTRGFGTRWWAISEVVPTAAGEVGLRLNHVSADGDGGYPGRLEVEVRYTLTRNNAWRIDWRATTDRPTVLNLTHHEYFNLAGRGSALAHRLQIAASRFLGIDQTSIPLQPQAVDATPFDFRGPTRVVERIRDAVPQLARARGYDHCWILDRAAPDDDGLAFAARLDDEVSGRWLEIDTTEPAVQFYSSNLLDGSLPGNEGALYRQGDALCLETQHYPDAPNRPDFPSTVLRPGQTFSSTTVYRFGVAAASA